MTVLLTEAQKPPATVPSVVQPETQANQANSLPDNQASSEGQVPPDDQALPKEQALSGVVNTLPKRKRRKSAFSMVINEYLGDDNIPDEVAYNRLAGFTNADDENVAKKTITEQLTITLMNGESFSFCPATEESGRERIESVGDTFSQETAEAMVAAAALKGWRKLGFHGSPEDKDKLWLAVQHMNMLRATDYEQREAAGQLREGEQPPVLLEADWTPQPDSAVYQQFQKEQAEFQKRHGPGIGKSPKASTAVAVAEQAPATVEVAAPAAPVTPAPGKPVALPEARDATVASRFTGTNASTGGELDLAERKKKLMEAIYSGRSARDNDGKNARAQRQGPVQQQPSGQTLAP